MGKKSAAQKGGAKSEALKVAALAAVKREGDPAMLDRVQEMAQGYEERIERQKRSLGGVTDALTQANVDKAALEQRVVELEEDNARLNSERQEPPRYGGHDFQSDGSYGYGSPDFSPPYGSVS